MKTILVKLEDDAHLALRMRAMMLGTTLKALVAKLLTESAKEPAQ